MAFRAALLALAVGSASALVAPTGTTSRTALSANLADLEGAQKPLGVWDPLNLAEETQYGPGLLWYRAAELKHGRVAMAAFVGFCVQGLGVHFPGMISLDKSWADCVGPTPLDTWDNLPLYAQYQIIAWIGLMEVLTEIKKPHYLNGGKMGVVDFSPYENKWPLWDPLKTMKNLSEEAKARKRLVELQNGRAAMFGVIGFVYAYKMDGSVPLLNFFQDYSGGLPQAPFAGHWHL